ncbi:MAG: hypothetical protein ACYDCK_09755 [Thermoplasmatota archaeon]
MLLLTVAAPLASADEGGHCDPRHPIAEIDVYYSVPPDPNNTGVQVIWCHDTASVV